MNSAGMVLGERVVRSDSCSNGLCNVTFSSFDVEENGNYYASIVVSNDVEQSTSRVVTSARVGELL